MSRRAEGEQEMNRSSLLGAGLVVGIGGCQRKEGIWSKLWTKQFGLDVLCGFILLVSCFVLLKLGSNFRWASCTSDPKHDLIRSESEVQNL